MEFHMSHVRVLKRSFAATMATMMLLAGAAVALSACNTTAGAGKDVSATGKAVTNTADDVKQKM
jgi:entericidin B